MDPIVEAIPVYLLKQCLVTGQKLAWHEHDNDHSQKAVPRYIGR